MPGKVGVKIKAGRNLPIMDRTNETTDAYVEIKLGTVTQKTDVCRKSLNPQWNTDWFRFELDDAELQDEPLQIRLMDHDTYSANDAIGKVNISLNPLCLDLGKGTVISGWLPVFDTMHGIRGEVFVTVKVDLFSDANKFRQSSCGVQFFHSPCVPHGYRAQVIHGFVEELVVNDDPEYQWIDKIRTPRASNEARQVVFQKLSGQVQRKMGLKAINLGANSVTGYKFCFDLEGDVGVVARGIGTAVSLVRIQETPSISQDNALIEESSSDLVSTAVSNNTSDDRTASPAKQQPLPTGHARTESLSMKMSQSPKVGDGSNNNSLTGKDINNGVCRRSSDSDLSITPKGNSICVASDRLVQATALMKLNQATILKPTTEGLEMLEYPFLTMCKFPAGFILHLGSTVAARSVKLLERVPNPDEPEIRDSWWTELRMEIRSHARALGCNVVLGYLEETTISDDACVLSATGTAAVINMSYNMESSQSDLTTSAKMVFSLDEKDMFKENKNPDNIVAKDMSSSYTAPTKLPSIQSTTSGCVLSHVPYNPVTVPFSCKLKKCAICKKARVPDVLLATIELPETLLITGRGCLLQAQVLRAKKDLRSESNAKEISDGLPFLEYELHRLLINKLKAKGMNAIFGLKVQVTVGEKMMALVATGTAVYLSSLPPPSVPKIVAGNSWTDKVRLIELQKCLQETFERNREIYQLKSLDPDCVSIKQQSDTDDSDDELQEMDLNSGSKDTCVLEVDDIEDLEIISLLIESCPPEGFHVVNTQSVPGLQDLEVDEIQVLITGMALGLGEPSKMAKSRRKAGSDSSQSGTNGKKSTEDDLIFNLDEDQNMDGSYNPAVNYGTHSLKLRKNSPSRTKFSSMRLSRHLPLRDRYGVDITPLSYVPGGKIDKYLGNLNFFFIRETTSIKEIGGISGFVHGFITELLAIVRAHITALGGNAIVSFYMTELILVDNQHKNQGQCLVSIGGDVVNVSYFPDD